MKNSANGSHWLRVVGEEYIGSCISWCHGEGMFLSLSLFSTFGGKFRPMDYKHDIIYLSPLGLKPRLSNNYVENKIQYQSVLQLVNYFITTFLREDNFAHFCTEPLCKKISTNKIFLILPVFLSLFPTYFEFCLILLRHNLWMRSD